MATMQPNRPMVKSKEFLVINLWLRFVRGVWPAGQCERRNIRSPLISISRPTTPAHRSSCDLSLHSRFTVFCHTRSPLRSRSLDFVPLRSPISPVRIEKMILCRGLAKNGAKRLMTIILSVFNRFK